ncbi:chorismate mutase [Streptomyces sp. NRRL S-1813]|uniref:chorismate mutase n=1 Tax=Streptomyces sp. NRRL S-1813 TaxID=1463888 RepID=UPI0004C81A67|nr:chorismate mutase [Streptomyces sp. NRRL S-1813]
MQLIISMRSALTAGAAAAVLLTGTGGAVAAPAAPPVKAPVSSAAATTPAAATAHSVYGRLGPLAGLSAERLATGDLVAAAKWGTGGPIDDPAREQEVLDAVADQARRLGADPAATVRIFRDQIEASKVVQRGLHRRWHADPAQAPTTRPDLDEVRKEINRINGELVRAIARSPHVRSAPYCTPLLTVAAAQVRHERHLDGLHTAALARSLRSVCDKA